MGEVIFVRSGDLPEGFACVKEPECHFLQGPLVTFRTADLALSERAEGSDPVDPDTGIEEALHVPCDRVVPWRVAESAVLPRGAYQTLLLPIADHPRRDVDFLGEPRYRGELFVFI